MDEQFKDLRASDAEFAEHRRRALEEDATEDRHSPFAVEVSERADSQRVKWFSEQRESALQTAPTRRCAYTETRTWLLSGNRSWAPDRLLEAAEVAQIHTFGWPLGVVLHDTKYAPYPTNDGIVARVLIEEESNFSYDYWALRRNGDFYLRNTLFEDARDAGAVYFNTRVVRVAEAVMHTARLYTSLQVNPASQVRLEIRHEGFSGRVLKSVGSRSISERRPAQADEVSVAIVDRIDGLEKNIVEHVMAVCEPLFLLFDFARFSPDVYEDIVTRYVKNDEVS